MDVIEYNGKMYKRYDSKWCDENTFVVHETLQCELNHEFIKTLDISSMSVREMITEGDKFKKSASYDFAIKYYKAASVICDKKTMSYILPRLSSCYRNAHLPSKAIEPLSSAKARFGKDIITEALLTSAAAAYCDMYEFEKAKKCCDIACAKAKGRVSYELRLVYERIKKETK